MQHHCHYQPHPRYSNHHYYRTITAIIISILAIHITITIHHFLSSFSLLPLLLSLSHYQIIIISISINVTIISSSLSLLKSSPSKAIPIYAIFIYSKVLRKQDIPVKVHNHLDNGRVTSYNILHLIHFTAKSQATNKNNC